MPEKFNPDLFRFLLIKNEVQNFTFLYERFQLPPVTGDLLDQLNTSSLFIDFMGNLTQEFTTTKTHNKFHYNATSQLPRHEITSLQTNKILIINNHQPPQINMISQYIRSFGFFHLTAQGTFLIIHCLSAFLPVSRVFQLKQIATSFKDR